MFQNCLLVLGSKLSWIAPRSNLGFRREPRHSLPRRSLAQYFVLVCLIAQSALSQEATQAVSVNQQDSNGTTANAAPQAAEAQARVAPMRLRLKNNGFGVGKIVPSRTSSVIGWQNAGFVEPFFFDVSAVRSISTIQAADQDAEKQKSHFLIESTDGQSITGQITGLDSDWLTIQSTILGEVQLPINRVGQIIRADYTGEIIYSGLNQQAAWSPIGQPSDWDIRAGVLTALKQGAASCPVNVR
jgi:hypothetical protein